MFISLINTFQLFILSIWLQFYTRKQLHIVEKEAIWRPFCICKLDGQELKILLGNRVYRIQHTQIRLKSRVPCFYPKMPLDSYRAPFFRNPTRLMPMDRCSAKMCFITVRTWSTSQSLPLRYFGEKSTYSG